MAKLRPARGILAPSAIEKKFALQRHAPSDDLARLVENHWSVAWDLAEPHVQETLPHPCVNLVIEEGRSELVGIVTTRFTRVLEGKGRVFATKLRPGAFFPFVGDRVASFVDASAPLGEVFGPVADVLADEILSTDDEHARMRAMETFLRTRSLHPHPQLAIVERIVQIAEEDRSVRNVDDLLAHVAVSARTAQRLFRRYVGVGPKWVILRYRLLDALERITAGEVVDRPALAAELGYFRPSALHQGLDLDHRHPARPSCSLVDVSTNGIATLLERV